MNYLDPQEVPLELLHRNVLEKLGYRFREDTTGFFDGYIRSPGGTPNCDIWVYYPIHSVQIDDNLCRKLRALLTEQQLRRCVRNIIGSYLPTSWADICSITDLIEDTEDLMNFLNASPEEHLRAMMQAMGITVGY